MDANMQNIIKLYSIDDNSNEGGEKFNKIVQHL